MSARDFLFALDIGIGVALGITAGGAIVLVGWRFFLALSERRLALQRKSKWFRSEFILGRRGVTAFPEAEQKRREGEFAERLRSLNRLWKAADSLLRDAPPGSIDPHGSKGR
jgi:hypothetical protein